MNPKVRIEHRHRVAPDTDRAGAGGMMSPGLRFDEFPQRGTVFHLLARKLLLRDEAADLTGQRAYELDSVHDGIEILGAAAGAFAEIMEIDDRRIERGG